ncbi:hypothetical protein [Pseudomonas sp. GM67]|uniref:hypothetical protein n=1 Tax=Pseudomonas sp. GM67 TaxID=1144335 RepID=UPI000270BBC0|nr:hypothetical protein [Pseudomonas sp. GM67]EJM92397.1 hypothetical protein PMI33_00654 [Pseudomonas sp. GM67]
MSQHDMTLDNASGLVFRNDANAALQALASQSSGASAPSPTFPCQVWGDTGTGRLKQRNAANSAWLDKGPLDAPLRDAASQGEFVADTGAAGAYVCNFVPALTARSESTPLRFKAANANTAAATINDGLGVVAIVGAAHAALQGGEIIANGIAWIQWNASIGGGSYVLLFCTGAPQQVADATKSKHAVTLAQIQPPVVGSTRNGKMSITAASATATFTADEAIVETALGGTGYKLSSLSKTINLATTGAGGMDTGSAPVSGWVAVYLIYNPTTLASAMLAKNATAGVQTEVYSGANMPSGYTASALIGVMPTNGSSQFGIAYLDSDSRKVATPDVNVLSTSSNSAGLTSLSLSTAIPPNAKSVGGYVKVSASSAGDYAARLSANSVGIGQTFVTGGYTSASGYFNLVVITLQTMWYAVSTSAGTLTALIYVTSYTF